MNAASLRVDLATTRFGRELEFYEVTDSTNTRAKEALETQSLPEGFVFIAATQTAGRGVGEHHWESSEPEGLLFSLVVQTPITRRPLSFMPAIAIARMLGERHGLDAHLKWPNDVLIGSRKVSGILCENAVQPDGSTAWIIGVGLNVNQTAFGPEVEDRATSLRMIAGKPFSIESVFADLMAAMEAVYDDTTSLPELWLEHTRMVGRPMQVTDASGTCEVEVTGIDTDGHLCITRADGTTETWASTAGRTIVPTYG
ncbi:MAG: BirA family biotin operon repressor/biotin-[acetyl-CoA-carboxylase] ligase [Candidatus Poriferisodalaceae bacterium]|jgi:BirA family biotin operon repressor/biotin-[acetyl-CoA-carboxylase] ligase